jgi:hypothetical protein
MSAEKTPTPMRKSSYVSATMVLTNYQPGHAKTPSIEASDGASLSQKMWQAAWL